MQLVQADVVENDHVRRIVRIGDDRIAMTVVGRIVGQDVGGAAEHRFCQLDYIRILEVLTSL